MKLRDLQGGTVKWGRKKFKMKKIPTISLGNSLVTRTHRVARIYLAKGKFYFHLAHCYIKARTCLASQPVDFQFIFVRFSSRYSHS